VDERRFDWLTRRLADPSSRRRVLSTLAGGALGLLPVLSWEAAAATCLATGKACKRGSQCCSGLCKGKKGKKKCRPVPFQSLCTTRISVCLRDDLTISDCGLGSLVCDCQVTTAGRAFCSDSGIDSSDCDCASDQECQARLGAGAACVRRAGNSCDVCRGPTFCALPCPDPV